MILVLSEPIVPQTSVELLWRRLPHLILAMSIFFRELLLVLSIRGIPLHKSSRWAEMECLRSLLLVIQRVRRQQHLLLIGKRALLPSNLMWHQQHLSNCVIFPTNLPAFLLMLMDLPSSPMVVMAHTHSTKMLTVVQTHTLLIREMLDCG